MQPVAVLTIFASSAANPTSTENGVIVLAPETSPVVPHVCVYEPPLSDGAPEAP